MKEPKLKQALETRNLTIYQIIQELHLKTGSHLYDYANAKKDMKLETAHRIVEVMNKLCPEQPTTINDIT